MAYCYDFPPNFLHLPLNRHKTCISTYFPAHIDQYRLTIVALGLLAEPREERLAEEGVSEAQIVERGVGGPDGWRYLTSHAAWWRQTVSQG